MHLGISIYFRSRGLKNSRPDTLGQPQHVNGSNDAGLNRLDRVVLIMNRRRGTGQVIDLIDFEQDGFNHIVTQKLKLRIAHQVRNILSPSREKVVETDYFVLFGQQPFAEMDTAHQVPQCLPACLFVLGTCLF